MRENWPLVDPRDDGIRPAGKPDECFFCRQPVGYPHLPACVIVTKRVRLCYSIEVDVAVPFDWTVEDIEFHRNESSWCAENAIAEIMRHTTDGGSTDCLCSRFTATFVTVLDETPRREIRPSPAGTSEEDD